MEYTGDTFQIHIAADTITFSGTLEKKDYTEVLTFLEDAEEQMTGESITLDLRALRFINSAGIKMIAVFLTGSPKSAVLMIDHRVEWQKQCISTLHYLKPEGITVLP